MKAIEAAEHSDVIYNPEHCTFLVKDEDEWRNTLYEKIDLTRCVRDDYTPLVPKKIYNIGDKVSFLEACQSGMCFRLHDESPVQKFDGKLKLFNRLKKEWAFDDIMHVNIMAGETYTLCEDPSIPPKPTLESLPAWTRCKVRPVNHNSEWQVIKKPSGSLLHYCSGSDFEWVNVELISIYNPKNEQWEDV